MPALNLVLEHNLKAELGLQKCPVIACAQDIAAFLAELAEFDREVMVAGALDIKLRLLHWRVVGVGTNDHLILRVGDVFQGAVAVRASGIFLAHNHPSGSVTPSPADIKVTSDVAEGGLLLGYPLIDHVVIAQEGMCSLLSLSVLQRYERRIRITPAAQRIAADGSLSTCGWRCLSCGHTNLMSTAMPQMGRPSPAHCIAATCRHCKSFTWLKGQDLLSPFSVPEPASKIR